MESFVNEGLRFDVTERGPVDGEAVILLHGFPADRHSWDAVTAELAGLGYRTLAPDQRGYSPRARPQGREAYRVDALAGDVIALADQAGAARFHVVGHDWGAAVAWYLAGHFTDRVVTLSAVSVPHPAAMGEAIRHGTQALHSWYMLAVQVPALPERLLAWRQGTLLARALRSSGLDTATAVRYAARLAEAGAQAGPLGWYRALPLERSARPMPVVVPTVMIWGPDDGFITRRAVEATAKWVKAPYRFVEIPGGDHWLPELRPDAVAAAIVDRICDHP